MSAKPLLLCLLIAFGSNAQIYKWVDDDGKVHYSDKPRSGATAVSLKPGSTVHLPTSTRSLSTESQADEQIAYRIDLIAPEDEATVRNNQGQLDLQIALEPALAADHRVQLWLDGRLSRTLGSGGSFALDDLDRGEHQLQAKVIDKSGKVLALSPTRTVFMHRHSRLFPAAGAQPKVLPATGQN
ncbi:DUF4124 domain-containing protein [Ferrimonas pelagia]|uniref:DUF4124 domain-containing protein n=1 Tax=Ferrimonas pelagia TaxID=1177826 RepID=A0ABP9F4D9_9GAMM